MRKITIFCGACGEEFYFQHPSIDQAAQLGNITLDCPRCNISIGMAKTWVRMERVSVVQLKAPDPEDLVGLQVEVEMDQGDIADVISISRPSKYNLGSKERLTPTPAVMPPHPPARKPHLTQRLGDAVTRPRKIKDTPQA